MAGHRGKRQRVQKKADGGTRRQSGETGFRQCQNCQIGNGMASIFKKIGAAIVKPDETIEQVGKLIDNVSTSDEEKLKFKSAITELITNTYRDISDAIQQVVLADANGNWLQRSWRPILLLAFGFVLLVNYTVFPMIGKPPVDFPVEFWTFLEIVMPTAVVARSFDKSSMSVLKNIDLPFIRKKDRKNGTD